MIRFAKSIALTATCLALALCAGCSSPTSTRQSAPNPAAPAAPASNPVTAAKQYPRPAQDLSSFDPGAEAAKIGIQLYPGATLYSSPYTLRRENYYIQHGFFTTADSLQQVSEFYDSIYGGNNFTPDAKGNLSAMISPIALKDSYKFDLRLEGNGNTNIEVTRIHSCENMYPKPCDSNGDAPQQ